MKSRKRARRVDSLEGLGEVGIYILCFLCLAEVPLYGEIILMTFFE